jgi:hypothetical protein
MPLAQEAQGLTAICTLEDTRVNVSAEIFYLEPAGA